MFEDQITMIPYEMVSNVRYHFQHASCVSHLDICWTKHIITHQIVVENSFGFIMFVYHGFSPYSQTWLILVSITSSSNTTSVCKLQFGLIVLFLRVSYLDEAFDRNMMLPVDYNEPCLVLIICIMYKKHKHIWSNSYA